MSAIRVEHISKKFDGNVVVDNVSFTVEEGELAALLGPSGSGKSTLLRILAGLERQDHGQVVLLGQTVEHLSPQQRGIGFVFQHYALFTHMTVFENIAFGLEVQKIKKIEIASRVSELINLVKLVGYEKRYPHQLSGGQRQRVALARALAPRPKLLLLDEPFGALDAKVRKNLGRWLKLLHRSMKVTTLFVTHDQVEAMEIADRLILLNNGRIEQCGSPREVYDDPQTRFSASFLGQVNVLLAKKDGEKSLLISEGPDQMPDGGGDPMVLLVRYEDVSLQSPGKSGVAAEVRDARFRGAYYEIEMEANGQAVIAHVDRRSWEQKDFDPMNGVSLAWRKFQLFNASEGHDEVVKQLSDLGYLN